MKEISREMTSIVGMSMFCAVADDVVEAAVLDHRDAVLDRALLAHEVDDRLGAEAVGQLLHRVDVRAVDLDGVVGAELAGELQGGLGGIDDDDLGRRVGLQALDADVAQAAGADDDDLGPRAQDRDRLLDRVDRRQPRVGQRRDVGRRQRRVELDHRPRAREQEVGEAAVAVDARERAVLAVHVVARAARAAQPAGDERVHDDRVADLDVRDRRADLVDPAGVLVAGRVGQLDLGLLGPLALLDVQIGAAQPRRADAHDDVERAADLRLVDLVHLQWLVVRVQTSGLHAATSCWSGQPYRTCSSERHSPPLVSRLRLTRRARRSQVGRSSALSGLPSPATSAASSGPQGSPSSPRSSTQRPASTPGARSATRSAAISSRRQTAGKQALAHACLTGDQRLAPEQLAQGVQRALGLARERVGELTAARERRVDLGARVVILEHDAHAA